MIEEVKEYLKKYGVIWILIILHLFGGIIANLAIIVTSLYAFFYFSFRKNIDLYTVFLLLITNICMAENSDVEGVSNINVGFYGYFKNVLIVGPVALSTKFTFALAVPIRALFTILKNRSFLLLLIWFVLVLLALAGLFLSYSSGLENKAGLTVGFRIALILGVVLLPKMIYDREEFLLQFDRIIFTSLIFLSLGLMNAHWLFVTYGFIPYLWFRFNSIPIRILIFWSLLRIIVGLETTITIVGTLITSSIFSFFSMVRVFNLKSIKTLGILLLIVPVLITIYVIALPIDKVGYDFDSILGYIKFKLIGDRKPIWDASYSHIVTSNFFLAPSGSSLEVYFDYIQQWKEWPEGSHNIFLEIGRQISGFGMIVFSLLILRTIGRAFFVLKNMVDLRILMCFTSVYMVFGLSGQHIVYDGVGFMFWLLISQFVLVNLKENESIAYIGG